LRPQGPPPAAQPRTDRRHQRQVGAVKSGCTKKEYPDTRSIGPASWGPHPILPVHVRKHTDAKPGGKGSKSLIPITAAGSAWAMLGLVRTAERPAQERCIGTVPASVI